MDLRGLFPRHRAPAGHTCWTAELQWLSREPVRIGSTVSERPGLQARKNAFRCTAFRDLGLVE